MATGQNRFAAVFEVGEHQVLLYYSTDHDDTGEPKVRFHQIMHVNGIEMDMALVFNEDVSDDRLHALMTQEHAEKFVRDALEIINGVPEE